MFRCGTEVGQQPKPSNCFPRIPPLSNCTNPPLSSCTNPPNGFPNIPPLLNTTPQTNCFSNFAPPRNCNHSPSECCRQQQVVIHHHHYYYYPPHWNNLPPPYNFSQTPNVPNPIGFSLHRDLPKPPSVCRPPVPWCTTTDELSKNRTPSPPASSHKNIYWKDSSLGQEMPLGAVAGGRDIDGESIYIGRAYHEGDWLPAKVIPGRKCCYVSYNGLEHPKTSYQILCDSRSTWLPAKNGEIQPDAVEGGVTDNGEKLYIGRVRHNGSLTVGKIHPSHGVCYIPFDGKEINFPEYEVLISGWLTKPHVAAGRGKYFDFNEEEEKSEEKYEEETEQKSEEEKKQDDEISIGFEDLFNDNDYTTWETTDLDNMPPGAVEGGYDADGSPIFVGRAFHEGDWMPAKVIPSKKYVAVSYGGAEYSKTSFQVLCAPHAEWVPGFNGQVPPDAIEGGKTAYGEKLYIGRAKYLSSLTVGKIHPSYGLCYIPFGQKEISYPEYEVLVSGRSNVSKDPEPILPFRKGGKKGYRRCGKRNFTCEVID